MNLLQPMNSEEALKRLEAIRDNPDLPEVTKRRAQFYITEVMEDIIDHGGHFNCTDDYFKTITPPPHTGHLL